MTNRKKYSRMTQAELARATAEFAKEFVADTFGPPPKEAQDRWKRAKARRGRPRKGEGARVISVSVEKGLLERSDRLARKLGITRAELIAWGLQASLAAAEESS